MANPTRIPSSTTDIRNQFEDMKNKAEEIKDRAEQAGAGLMDKARQTISAAGDQADSATSAVGSGMSSLAESIRGTMPREGVMGTTTEKVANTLESGGRYLQEEGFAGIIEDVTNVVRRNPLPALCLGVGLGFILARTLRRLSSTFRCVHSSTRLNNCWPISRIVSSSHCSSVIPCGRNPTGESAARADALSR